MTSSSTHESTKLLNRMEAFVAKHGGWASAMDYVARLEQTLIFIEVNASAGELSAEGCAIQARAALRIANDRNTG